MTDDLISRAAALAECQKISDDAKSYSLPQMAGGANACREAIRALPAVAASQSADPIVKVDSCPECGNTGMRDTGGVYPWGEGIFVPCDHNKPATDPRDAVIAGLETILNERSAVFDAMVDAAEDAAGKDVSFNVVIGRSLRAAIAAAKGGAA